MPRPARSVGAEKDQLLVHRIAIEKLLIERTDATAQNVPLAEFLSGIRLFRGAVFDLQQPPTQTDLKEIRAVFVEIFDAPVRWVQHQRGLAQTPVQLIHKLPAQLIERGAALLAKAFHERAFLDQPLVMPPNGFNCLG